MCLVRLLTAIRQKDVTNVGLHALNLVNLKVLFEDGAIGTSTWVIYPKVTLMLLLYGYLYPYTSGVVVPSVHIIPRRGLTGC